LYIKNSNIKGTASPAYVALRQRHQDYQAGVQMRFTPGNEQECAGIAVTAEYDIISALKSTLKESRKVFVLFLALGEKMMSLPAVKCQRVI